LSHEKGTIEAKQDCPPPGFRQTTPIRLNVFQQNINRYEHGTLPHVDFLITLSRAENVSVDWLLLGRGSRNLR
jgi:hypothetical protein